MSIARPDPKALLALTVKRQIGVLPKYIFSMRLAPQSGTGLVQQTVQIVASHDLTLVVRRLRQESIFSAH